MSGKLQIHFAPDMPPAAVEVVSPDLQTVGRVWASPGASAEIDVPSEASFLRVHMPSGQIVTLHDPGNLDRRIDLGALVEHTQRRPTRVAPSVSKSDVEAAPDISAARIRDAEAMGGSGAAAPPPKLANDVQVQLMTSKRHLLAIARTVGTGAVDVPSGTQLMEPLDLRVTTHDGQLGVRLPGLLSAVRVSNSEMSDGLRVVAIRVRTTNREADALGSYISRGDLHSAAAMTPWADRAEQLLFSKMDDPFAAALGAYLLLRLRRFDLMRTWARNLANGWPTLADGSVIWAWQQIHQRGSEPEIRDYLMRAANAGLPVFTEGLKLLNDGLRLLGSWGSEVQRKLNTAAGIVLWDSPFTASIRVAEDGSVGHVRFEVGYGLAW
jgi:hypothetical protein